MADAQIARLAALGWLIHLRKRDELVERFRHVDI